MPSLCWHLCPRCASLFVLIAWVSSSLLYPYCCQHCTGIFADIALGLLPSSAGIFAFVALVSLPFLRWHLRRCCAGVVALSAGIVGAGVFTGIALVPLSLMCCCPHRGEIFSLVALASLPAFCTGINLPYCAGVFTVILLALPPTAQFALASLPSLHWCRHRCFVVCTNIGSHMIVHIDTHGPLHPFTTIHALIFNRSLDCDLSPKLSQACFHNGGSCNAIASLAAGNSSLVATILRAIILGLLVLAGHCFSWLLPCWPSHGQAGGEMSPFSFVLGLPSP